MGEPEQKASGVGWIIVFVAVLFLGVPCVGGAILLVICAGLPLIQRTRQPADPPAMQVDRMPDLPTETMPRIQELPEVPERPELPEMPDLDSPPEGK